MAATSHNAPWLFCCIVGKRLCIAECGGPGVSMVNANNGVQSHSQIGHVDVQEGAFIKDITIETFKMNYAIDKFID